MTTETAEREQTSETTTVERRGFELPTRPLPGPRRLARDFGALYAANGLVGLIFAATGPVAVILAVGQQGGLSSAQLASWIFGVFFLNGILTILACWSYRQPLGFFWTIPGAVLVGPALTHLAWPEVVGAFVATGVLILVLGLTGWVRRVMELIPMPIVMGMVAGVFLSFGLDLVRAVASDIAIAGPMVGLFVVLSWRAALGRWLPPIIGALLIGGLAVAVSGRFAPGPVSQWLAAPVFTTPQWSWQAMLELVIPLTITVLVVQNGQGVAVLRSAGHRAPVNMAAIACGVWSVLASFVGAVSTCLTGPTNALLVASGERSRHYIAGIACGVFAIGFGLFAPLFTQWMLGAPGAFIAALGGLAMLRVLQTSFVTAFSGRFTMGALITFVVTVSGVQVANISSAFWGLLAGLAVSWLLERADFTTRTEAA
ncbi:benzoate transporter [Allosaccharopolyspora coralli]|uniref:Benzoate transporter n=1 Tax=Allosaccharopolyspora coralli TaxID=2665642 RepID=A0A5Q3QHW2_9PSEU|nr:benzoate/H(+) symporter BenE family transporter [Allosaccharopolyspora coralli]QGK70427.1 benzoate transporter [Allosaccharopolyspora coralli]